MYTLNKMAWGKGQDSMSRRTRGIRRGRRRTERRRKNVPTREVTTYNNTHKTLWYLLIHLLIMFLFLSER